MGASDKLIVEPIKHIFAEGELDEVSTCWNFRQVRLEGTRQVTREISYYNLDMIISLGYRIKSLIATRFRKWAAERLKEYMIKGFTMDELAKLEAESLSGSPFLYLQMSLTMYSIINKMKLIVQLLFHYNILLGGKKWM